MYELARTPLNGDTKTQGPVKSVRDAAILASYVLHDNGLAPKAEAQRFAARMSNTPVGHCLTHEPSGYVFRINRV